MNYLRWTAAAVLAATVSATAWAQAVTVHNPWARATVQGQKATGAFMTLTAPQGARLVGASSPVAGVVEVHEMKMDGNVMQMRAVSGGLELPAGKPVALMPGGYHIMLMDLKLPLQKDTTIPLTLLFKDAQGVQTSTALKVPVAMAPPAGAGAAAMHGSGAHASDAQHGMTEHAAGPHSSAKPAAALPVGTDAQQITAVMKQQFDRPDAPLKVAPVTVQGHYAVAGWTQGGKGGRALLQKTAQGWVISVCAGDGLKDAKVLETNGMSAAQASQLAAAVQAAEATLSKAERALLASFEGMVKIGPGGHEAMPGPAGPGEHKH